MITDVDVLKVMELIKERDQLAAELATCRKALSALIDFVSDRIHGERRPTLGPIDGPGVVYVGVKPDDYEVIRNAKAALASGEKGEAK